MRQLVGGGIEILVGDHQRPAEIREVVAKELGEGLPGPLHFERGLHVLGDIEAGVDQGGPQR